MNTEPKKQRKKDQELTSSVREIEENQGTVPASTASSASSASFPLLSTKIRPPRLHPELLLRTRLVNLLHAHLDRKLIILSAPAGYGKTSLLVEFVAQSELPVCWLTLDAFDSDLRTFIEYLIACIAVRFPGFGVQSRKVLTQFNDPRGNLYPIMAAMVQEIQATIPEYFVIVLDDYQTVDSNDSIAEFLDLFVTYVDENCHVILSSRTLPALPNLVLLISRRQAAGLSIDELRFTPREIQALVQQNYHIEFNPQEADQLVQRTGGWITGIMLTADPYWKKGKVEIPQRGRISQELYDYLTTQLLSQQSPQMQDFLLVSSVLDEINPELLSSVLGLDQAEVLLEQVRQRNLFVAEYEGPGDFIRYHDLFRDYLRARFQKQNPHRYRQLSLRTAEYYAGRKEWERVIERYFSLGEYARSADLLEQLAPDFYNLGRWDLLASWLDLLPEETLEIHPRLLIQRGKIYGERGQHAQALALFEHAERLFTQPADLARVQVLRGSILRLQDHYTEAIALSQQALIYARGNQHEEQLTQALAYKNIGLCLLWLGKIDEGRVALRKAMQRYEELAIVQDIGMIHHDMGLVYELSGDLKGATSHYQTALTYWQKLGNLSPWANELNSLGVVYYLQGAYAQALSILNEALEKIQQVGDIRVQAYILGSLGDVLRETGIYSQAFQAYTQALELAHQANSGMMITYALDGLGNLARLQGNFSEARFRLQDAWEYAQDHNSAYELSLVRLSQGILANEMGDLVLARDHLLEVLERSEAAGLKQIYSRAALQLAQNCFLVGEWSEAWDYLGQALSLATQLGYDHFLVVDGSRLTSLISSATQQGKYSDQLASLMQRIKALEKAPQQAEMPIAPAESGEILQIRALGQPEVLLDGKPVQWQVQKSRDLFFLLLQSAQGMTREQIGAIFWPDHTPERLEPAFRSTLYRLRRAVARASVLFMDGLYRFNWSGTYWYDVRAFESLLDQAEKATSNEQSIALLEEALGLYRGDYLQDSYEDWCGLERERLRNRKHAALEKVAGLYATEKKFLRAIEWYQRLVKEDPYHERAHRELMRCLFRSGDRAAAIRQYHLLARLLWDELGLQPQPETKDLYLQIIG